MLEGSVHVVHTTIAQVERLEEVFAQLTAEGWVIPSWLVYLRRISKE